MRCWALRLSAAARAHRAPGVDDDVLATARLRVWHSPASLAKLDAVEPSAPGCAPDAEAVSHAPREEAVTKA